MLGRSTATKAPRCRGAGYDYPHVAVDDCSRYTHVEALPDEKGRTCAGFVLRAAAHLAELGVQIERVMTDRAMNWVISPEFTALKEIGAAHPPPSRTGRRPTARPSGSPYDVYEWAHTRLNRSNEARLAALPRWLEAYNRRVPTPRSEGTRSRLSTT